MQDSKPLTLPASAAVLVAALAVSFGAAVVGGFSTAEAVREWYPTLNRPPWTPPNWAFGPVWTTLYTAMAVAIWHIVRREGFGRARLPLALFGVQIALNALWSPLFFRWKLLGLALVEIGVLWLAIAACIVVFWRHSRLSSALMVPYLAWICVAASLNAWIWAYN